MTQPETTVHMLGEMTLFFASETKLHTIICKDYNWVNNIAFRGLYPGYVYVKGICQGQQFTAEALSVSTFFGWLLFTACSFFNNIPRERGRVLPFTVVKICSLLTLYHAGLIGFFVTDNKLHTKQQTQGKLLSYSLQVVGQSQESYIDSIIDSLQPDTELLSKRGVCI